MTAVTRACAHTTKRRKTRTAPNQGAELINPMLNDTQEHFGISAVGAKTPSQPHDESKLLAPNGT